MFQGIFKSAVKMPDTNTNYIFGTGSLPINIKTAQLATFADSTTKQQGYQVAEVNKLISTMLTGWDKDGNKPKSMSDNYLELILSSDNGFVVKKRLQFPHIIAWQNDSTPYNIADVYKEFSLDNWLKADDFENPDITLVVEPTDEILTTSTATPTPEVTTTNSGRFYLYYRNLPVGVNRVHIDFHIKTKTEPIDFDLEVIDGLSWKDAQTILASNEQAKINVLLSGVKDVYNFTGAEGDFGEITMHEWSALYQQIISLNPSNKFTHDLYFYIYDEVQNSTLNTYFVKTDLIGEAMWLFFDGGGGTVYEPCDTDPVQLTCMQTQNYLSFDRRFDYFVGVSGVDNKDLYIWLYDENFEFLKWLKFENYIEGKDIDTAINNTRCRYIKLTIQNTNLSKFEQRLYKVSISIKSKREPKWYFNGFGKNNSIQFRTYEINKPYITDNCSVTDGNATTDYRGENIRRFNWGYIVLPENYNINGKPVPVIIHCHGTSGVVFNQQSLPYNTKYLQFLAKCGYAVIGCSTFSNEYRNENDDSDFSTPLAMSCYENLWNYMTNGYNLDKTRAYIFGYSAGGMNAILFSQSKVLPIRAVASLAGSVDLISNMRILADYCNEFFYKQIGLGEVDLPTGLAADGIRMHPMKNEVTQQIIDNWDKFVGLNPFCFNSDLDYKVFLQKYSTLYNQTSSLEVDTELNEMIENSKVFFNMPIKFWHAVDDINVPIQITRWWCRMVKNGGGLCYMREFPSGCGAHYAVGYSGDESQTPMVDYITPFGEAINIPVAYAELVDWFNRW